MPAILKSLNVSANTTNVASASFALFAANATNAYTASYVENSQTASYMSVADGNTSHIGTGIVSSSAQALVTLQGTNVNSGSVQTLFSLQGSSVVSGSGQVVGLISTQQISPVGITSSLLGTASYAVDGFSSVSASYALTASYVSSVPNTASYSLNAETASFLLGSIASAISASYALTASHALNVPATASYALSALTASYALNASSGGGGGTAVVSGSVNFIAKYQTTSSLGNSIIFDNGTNVGINTTSSLARLHVSGTFRSGDITLAPTGSNNAKIFFSGSVSSSIVLEVLSDGTISFGGKSGSLFEISDVLTGSLMSVNDISGVPIFEVFSDDKMVVGSYASNALVVSSSSTGIRKNPNLNFALDISGSTVITGSLGVSGGITGSLLGTASYATFALTASYATNAAAANLISGSLYNITSSNAITASYALNSTGTVSGSQYYLTKYATTSSLSSSQVYDNGFNVGIGTAAPSYKLEVNGTFAALSKSFVITHPTKKNMKLQHGVVEGPEHSVYIRGKTTLDTIKLPDYWKGLVHEDTITVHLTPIATNQILVVKSVSLEEVTIQNKSKTAKSINCYYHIQGERKDISRLEVEY
jgi:hypothetical protein